MSRNELFHSQRLFLNSLRKFPRVLIHAYFDQLILLIITGYLAGITAKIMNRQT